MIMTQTDIQDYINSCNEELSRIQTMNSEITDKVAQLNRDKNRLFERKVDLEDRIETLKEILGELNECCVSDAKITPVSVSSKTVFRYEGFMSD